MEKEKALDVIKRQIGCYKNSEEQCFTLASCRGCKYNATIEEIIEAMQMAISALEKQEKDEWHSVAKEGNPKESGFYLWTSKDGTVREDYYRVRDDTWSKAWQFGYKVVAWKNEPEPYMEEE